MNLPFSDSSAALVELVSFLDAQRENILKNWRIACAQDPLLKNVIKLDQADFNSGLPLVLTILQQRLSGQQEEGIIAQIATAHGRQRHRKAHGVIQMVQELNHLTQTLYNELSSFQQALPHTNPQLFWSVQQHMTQIMAQVINGSIQVYDELQRSEAANRAAILQQALDQMTLLSHDRSDRLRTSMHDLGGGFGIINGAAGLLQMEGNTEQNKTDYLAMLNRNLTGVQAMLANLMDLSRLEADQETLQIKALDVAQLFSEMVRSVQPLAQERGLVVRADGPDSLWVETDGVKLQRIIQNLLLNALKYTATGSIDIAWALQGSDHWEVRIRDSGPGLPLQVVRLLTDHPESGGNPVDRLNAEQPQPARLVAEKMDRQGTPLAVEQPATKLSKGEGIGLKIVKEFSQLLSAKLAVEAAPGQGTSFCLWLPIRYSVQAELLTKPA